MGNQNNNFQLTETWYITTQPALCNYTAEFVCALHNDFEFGLPSRCKKKKFLRSSGVLPNVDWHQFPKFRHNLSGFIFMDTWKIGPISFPETSSSSLSSSSSSSLARQPLVGPGLLRSFAHSSLCRATFFQFLTSNILIS